MKWWKSFLLWALAFVLTASLAVYQRMTGPTHPLRGEEILDDVTVSYRLLRSYTEFEDLPVAIRAEDIQVSASLYHKRYKTEDDWIEVPMTRESERLVAKIPGQPQAGKIEYTIRVRIGEKDHILNNGQSVVARFKGKVPSTFLIIHIVLMFLGMLLAFRTGIEALRKNGSYNRLVNWTLAVVVLGGMILGPIVQKYAFGDFWTGFPFGTDLTDNKILLVVLFWVAAFFLKKRSKWWVAAATILMIIMYLIPHSTWGSELDYQTGQMKNKYSHNRVPSPDGLRMTLGRSLG